MLIKKFYDHCRVNYMRAEEAEMPCGGKTMHSIAGTSGGDHTKQNDLESACSSSEFL